MPYAIATDLERTLSPEKILQLTDDSADAVADSEVVAKVIADADGLIDGYLGAKYTVPFTGTIPPVVISLSTRIAVFYLFTRRSIKAPDDVRKQYDDAIEFLKRIADGEAVISGATPTPNQFLCDRDFEKDRDFRKRWDGGRTDSEKGGTFGTFDDHVG